MQFCSEKNICFHFVFAAWSVQKIGHFRSHCICPQFVDDSVHYYVLAPFKNEAISSL